VTPAVRAFERNCGYLIVPTLHVSDNKREQVVSMQHGIDRREHLTGDGPTVFEHVCRLGLEGIVSKRTDAPYRSEPSPLGWNAER
jgi:hypothetical protein